LGVRKEGHPDYKKTHTTDPEILFRNRWRRTGGEEVHLDKWPLNGSSK